MSVILEDFTDGVCTITFNRPDKKNPMNLELLKTFYAALGRAEEQGAEIIIIRGAGKAFSSGGDIVEFKDSDTPEIQIDLMADYLHRSIRKIRHTKAIVIAVVEGLAVGAGMSLSLACDLTIAARNAVMNMGYRRIGLTPDGGGSIFLSRLIGMKRFNELYLLSRNIDMEQAKDFGLVNFVVEESELEARLQTLVADLKVLPAEAVGYTKELVNQSVWSGLDLHLDRERLNVSELSKRPEFKERIQAILSKK